MFLKSENYEKTAIAIIGAVSLLAILFLFWLIYFSGTSVESVEEGRPFGFLRYVNGFLNFVASVFLCCGFYFIKKKDISSHQKMMVMAFISSALFLVSYIIYHYLHKDTPFLAEGGIRYVYFFILITHIALSVIVLPFIFLTFFYSITNTIAKHKKLARYVFPVWLYVSVTGVLIVLILDIFNP